MTGGTTIWSRQIGEVYKSHEFFLKCMLDSINILDFSNIFTFDAMYNVYKCLLSMQYIFDLIWPGLYCAELKIIDWFRLIQVDNA